MNGVYYPSGPPPAGVVFNYSVTRVGAWARGRVDAMLLGDLMDGRHLAESLKSHLGLELRRMNSAFFASVMSNPFLWAVSHLKTCSKFGGHFSAHN